MRFRPALVFFVVATSISVLYSATAQPLHLVSDSARMMSTSTRKALELKMAGTPYREGVIFRVATVVDFDGRTAKAVATEMENAYARESGTTTGAVLLLISQNDRQARIQATGTLYAVFSDVVSNKILEDNLIYYFRKGDIAGGIVSTSERILEIIIDNREGDHSARLDIVSQLFNSSSLLAFAFIVGSLMLLLVLWKKLPLRAHVFASLAFTSLFALTGVFGSLLGGIIVWFVILPLVYGMRKFYR